MQEVVLPESLQDLRMTGSRAGNKEPIMSLERKLTRQKAKLEHDNPDCCVLIAGPPIAIISEHPETGGRDLPAVLSGKANGSGMRITAS